MNVKVKYSRENFDPKKEFIVTRPFLFQSRELVPDEPFPFDRNDRSQVQKAKRFYLRRNIRPIEKIAAPVTDETFEVKTFKRKRR